MILEKMRRIMNLHSKILILLAILSFATCAHSPRNDYDTNANLLKEGFTGDDSLQLLLIVPPENHVKGLVARRESALNRARHQFTDLLAKRIAEYRRTNVPSCKSLDEELIISQAKELVEDAVKVADFFKEDESLAVVVKISKKNLKSAFECSVIKELSPIDKNTKR